MNLSDIKNLPQKTKQRFMIIAFVCLLLIAVFFILNTQYDLSWSHKGTLEVTAPKNETIVFIDQSIGGKISKEGEVLVKSISVGEHTILVHSNGNWPWKKDIVVKKNETISLKPFLLPDSPVVQRVEDGSEEYKEVITKFRTIKEGEKITIVSKDEQTTIEATASKITTIEKNGPCQNGCETFDTTRVIKNVDFFPGRNDVIVMAFDDGVFVLETSKNGTQNVQPIYQSGAENNFYVSEKSEGVIYILSRGKYLFKLVQ